MKTILSNAMRHGLWLILLTAALMPAVSRAQTSQYMSYQGYLTDGNGAALGSTNTGPKAYDVVFRIWDSATAGTKLFSELQTVTVDNGYFSVLLGQGTAYSQDPTLHVPLMNVFSNSAALSRYVELTVLGIGSGGSITILPRLQLVSSPFAFQAANALNITGTNVINAANFSTNLGVWQASGTNIYRVGGNVGIGVSSPTAALDISGVTHTSGPILLKGAGDINHGVGYATSVTNFNNLGAPDGPILWGYNGGALGAMNTGAQLDLVWTQSGNVGIGTTNPGSALDVDGNIELEGTHLIYNSANGVIDWGAGSLLFRTDTTAGNIGLYNTPMSLNANGLLTVGGTSAGYYFADRSAGPTWTWYAAGGNSFLYNSTQGNVMAATTAGNIGLGSSSPLLRLDAALGSVLGTSATSVGEHDPSNRGTKVSFGYAVSGGSEFAGMRAVVNQGTAGCGNTGDLEFWTWQCNTSGAREVMRVNGTGYVGIGTTSPAAPLDVETYSLLNSSGYAYGGNGSINEGYNQQVGVSIKAVNCVLGLAFLADSDARIKQPLRQSNPSEDLTRLNKIKVTDFTYVDKVAMGSGVRKKVIAQELERVYPEAVSKTVNFVPDVYALATSLVQNDGTMLLTMAKPHGLKDGDKVRWIDDKGAVMQSEVSKVDSDVAFEVKFDGHVNQVFVYGKEVNDFRVVDYEAISMLNVSATQELAKRLEKLESRETHLAELEQKAAKVETLEQEVSDLKNTVAELAKVVKNSKMAAQPASAIQTESATQPSFIAASLNH
jgi:hypothetical protein